MLRSDAILAMIFGLYLAGSVVEVVALNLLMRGGIGGV